MRFFAREPTPTSSWRMAVLFGHNTRTYKFPLAEALLQVASDGQDIIDLDALAQRYVAALLKRPATAPQVSTRQPLNQGDFLNVLSVARRDGISDPTPQLVAAAARNMPGMVMQKFHN